MATLYFRLYLFHAASQHNLMTKRNPVCWRIVIASFLGCVTVDFVSVATTVTTTHRDGNSITGN